MHVTKHRIGRIIIICLGLGGGAMLALPLTGCNTMEGAGEDVESAGNAVQDAADDND